VVNPLQPVTLGGTRVILAPLSYAHHDDLAVASLDGNLSAIWYTTVPAPDAMSAEITRRLELFDRGSMLPFAVLERPTGTVIGMTTFMNVDTVNRRVEIGSTWYCRRVWRTAVNTECKLLLLTHAFDVLDCIAVEFRTAFVNHRSRRAIERLGAKLDGVLRNHAVFGNGALRDTCVYSILPGEWPAVRAGLTYELGRQRD
jgi:RimJ/RimL family protein N-acetyltransferase